MFFKRILFVFIAFIFTFPLQADFSGRKRAHNFDYYAYESEEDIKAEIFFGKKLCATILGRYKLLKNKQVQDYVSRLGAALVSYVGRSELTYHFGVIESDDINAFASPGGYIVVTTGTIKAMKNEAELAGVLAHELIHVNEKHIVKKLKIKGQDKSVGKNLSDLMAGNSAFFKALDAGMGVLFSEGLDKADEYQADSMALDILIATGYNWRDYYNFLARVHNKMSKEHQENASLKKTHPSIPDRLKKMKTHIMKNRWAKWKGKSYARRFKNNVHI